jgi:hypothetical protein
LGNNTSCQRRGSPADKEKTLLKVFCEDFEIEKVGGATRHNAENLTGKSMLKRFKSRKKFIPAPGDIFRLFCS